MGIAVDTSTPDGWRAALAALQWQVEMGVTEVIGDMPVDAYGLPDRAPWAAAPPTSSAPAPQKAAKPAAEPYVPQISAAERAAAMADAAVAEAVARAGLARFPEDGSLLLALGVARLLQQDLAGGEEAFRKCLPRLSRGAAPAFGPVLEAAIASDYAKAAATFARMQVLSGNLFYGVIGRALEQAASAVP